MKKVLIAGDDIIRLKTRRELDEQEMRMEIPIDEKHSQGNQISYYFKG